MNVSRTKKRYGGEKESGAGILKLECKVRTSSWSSSSPFPCARPARTGHAKFGPAFAQPPHILLASSFFFSSRRQRIFLHSMLPIPSVLLDLCLFVLDDVRGLRWGHDGLWVGRYEGVCDVDSRRAHARMSMYYHIFWGYLFISLFIIQYHVLRKISCGIFYLWGNLKIK